jgi:hypothetical protein
MFVLLLVFVTVEAISRSNSSGVVVALSGTKENQMEGGFAVIGFGSAEKCDSKSHGPKGCAAAVAEAFKVRQPPGFSAGEKAVKSQVAYTSEIKSDKVTEPE